MALQVFLLAFILRRVDSEAYGIVLLVAGLQTMMYLLRDAISKGCVTHVARYREESNIEMISKVISSAVSFLFVLGAVLMIVVAVAAVPVSRFFDVRPDLCTTMIWIVLLGGLNVLLMFPWFPFRSILEAYQRYDIISIVTIVFDILRAAIIVTLFLVFGGNIIFVMIATVVADVTRLIAMCFFAHRLVPALRVRPSLCNRKVLKSLLAFGSFLVYASLAAVVGTEAVKWMVGKLLSVEFVTFLTIAMFVPATILRIVQTMTLVLVPVASRYKALENQSVLGEMFVRGTRYSCLTGAAAAAVLLPVIAPLLSLWLGPQMAWIGPFAVAIGICGAISVPHACAHQVLNGMGDSKRPFIAMLSGGVVTVVVIALTTVWLRWGFLGAIVASGAGLMVQWAWMTCFALRSIRVKLRHFVWKAYLQPIFAAVPAATVGVALNYFYFPGTWGRLLVICAASGLTYVVFFLPFVTSTEWWTVRSALRPLRKVFGSGGNK